MKDISERFCIEELPEPVEMHCPEPGCTEVHGKADFVLSDHKLRVRVGFATVEDALEHINTLPSVQQ